MDYDSNYQGDPAGRERGKLGPKQQRIFDIMQKVRRTYIRTANDDEVLVRLQRIERGVEDGLEPGHALLITGDSGAGKSTSVKKALKSLTRLVNYTDEYGEEMRPIFYLDAPSACSMIDLAKEMLNKLGYETVSGTWGTIVGKLRRSLQNYGVRVVVIDEAQHILESPQYKGAEFVSNALKNMLQDSSWRVHIVLVGLPKLTDLYGLDVNDQMKRRTDDWHISYKETPEYIEWMVYEFIENRAGLALSDDQPHELVERLIHGACQRLGLMAEILHHAIEHALEQDRSDVITEDWIASYARLAKCYGDLGNIVFHSDDWRGILRPVNADGTLGPARSRD